MPELGGTARSDPELTPFSPFVRTEQGVPGSKHPSFRGPRPPTASPGNTPWPPGGLQPGAGPGGLSCTDSSGARLQQSHSGREAHGSSEEPRGDCLLQACLLEPSDFGAGQRGRRSVGLSSFPRLFRAVSLCHGQRRPGGSFSECFLMQETQHE